MSENYKVIDCAVTPPFKEFFIEPAYMENYFRVYGKELEQGLKDLLSFGWTPEAFIKYLDDENIGIAVIRARDIETSYGMKIPNEACAELVNKYPTRLLGMAGADPYKGKTAAREIERAVRELGLKGVDLWTYEYNLPASDHAYYPIYEKCAELNVPVFIETSMHFRRDARMDVCRPIHLDYVAVDFPELKLVGSTPGFPWVSELVSIAWRHPNVYISTSTVRPKYFGTSGYESLLELGSTVLKDKIMYASGWPMLPMKRGAEEIRSLNVKEGVAEKWLYRNAAALFGIDG